MPMGEFPPGNNVVHPLTWPSGPHNTGTTKQAWLIMCLAGSAATARGHVRFIQFTNFVPSVVGEQDWSANAPGMVSIPCPPDISLTEITIYDSTGPIGWALDLYAQ